MTLRHATTGAGKTRVLPLLYAAAVASGGQVWIADPGARHSELANEVAQYASGITNCLAMLQAATALLDQRAASGATHPRITLLVDELSHLAAAPEASHLLEHLLTSGRQAGIDTQAFNEIDRTTAAALPSLPSL